jgi:hypothetical protein
MKKMVVASRAFLATVIAAAMLGAAGAGESPAAPKKVLVELYTSQGCDSCPPAADLLGRLAELGYGPDRVVPVAFHVDYFNDPWQDPFSDPEFSRRQWSYNSVQKRNDLYFTPMMMVDGRYPLLGSDRPKALAAIARALKERPGVTLQTTWDGQGETRSLTVEVASPSNGPVGREVLVGVAVVEDPVATDVPSGENAGKTLVEHHAVRSFAHRFVQVGRTGSKSLEFPLKLGNDWVAERCRVAVFVQDRANGKVYQADSLSWAQNGRVP